MGKSVYSLVLMDEVIEEIDKEAGRLGLSRSNLINSVLAQHVSFTTPQQRTQNAFSEISKIIGAMKYLSVASEGDSIISVRSPISYKYNPTVRYSFAVLDLTSNPFGEIKAAFRTQSREFIYYVNIFFKMWHNLENSLAGEAFSGGVEAEISDGKYIRKLKLPKNIRAAEAEIVGRVVAEYIKLLDWSIKLYFKNLGNENQVFVNIENEYLKFANNNPFIV